MHGPYVQVLAGLIGPSDIYQSNSQESFSIQLYNHKICNDAYILAHKVGLIPTNGLLIDEANST